jgi:hypothetical protein
VSIERLAGAFLERIPANRDSQGLAGKLGRDVVLECGGIIRHVQLTVAPVFCDQSKVAG